MPTVKQIKDSLISQLKEKEAAVPYAMSLVDDYGFLWIQKNKMQTSIRKHGMTIPAVSSLGKDYDKENPAVKMVLLYEKQMLQILEKLNITTDNTVDPNSTVNGGARGADPPEEDEDDAAL